MTKRLHISIVLLFCYGFLFANNPKLTAESNKTTIATGQRFQVKFTVNASGNRFRPPSFSDFRLLGGPYTSTKMSIINGNMSRSESFTYQLMAIKTGTYTLKPATINVDGNELSSNTIEITVVKGKKVANQQNQSQSNDQQSPANVAKEGNNKDIFMRLTVNKTKVYEGEPVIASYKLYTRVNISDNEPEKFPDLNGFWKKDLLDPSSGVKWKTTNINGQRYNVAELKRSLLFPLHSGDIKIDPWIMGFTIRKPVQTRSRSVFDNFFGHYKNVKIKVSSNTVAIHVKPLPSKGKPKDFDGAVGNYKLSMKLDKDSVTAGNAINLTIKVSGSGNLKLINLPKLNFPKGFETYDPDISDHFKPSQGTMVGSREFKYLLIPRYPGKYDLDKMHISFFNPKTKKYKTLKGPSLTVNVKKGKGGNKGAMTYTGTQKEDIAQLGNDIRYLKSNAEFKTRNSKLWNTPTFYALTGSPFLLFLLALAYRKKQEKDQSNWGKIQNRQANKMANSYLKDAKRQLKANNKTAFYEAILNALNNYLSYKLHIDSGSLTRDTINEQLTERNVGKEHVQQLNKIIEECEMAQYAPIESKSNETVLNNAAQVIKNIEKGIRNA